MPFPATAQSMWTPSTVEARNADRGTHGRHVPGVLPLEPDRQPPRGRHVRSPRPTQRPEFLRSAQACSFRAHPGPGVPASRERWPQRHYARAVVGLERRVRLDGRPPRVPALTLQTLPGSRRGALRPSIPPPDAVEPSAGAPAPSQPGAATDLPRCSSGQQWEGASRRRRIHPPPPRRRASRSLP